MLPAADFIPGLLVYEALDRRGTACFAFRYWEVFDDSADTQANIVTCCAVMPRGERLVYRVSIEGNLYPKLGVCFFHTVVNDARREDGLGQVVILRRASDVVTPTGLKGVDL